jgi:hypothetical protein
MLPQPPLEGVFGTHVVMRTFLPGLDIVRRESGSQFDREFFQVTVPPTPVP